MITVRERVSDWFRASGVPRLVPLAFKGGTAIADQGLFSGSNFILNILLARWLTVEQYGAFALAFAIFIFFSGFHNALILEPISVFGTAKYSRSLKEYVGGQFIIHVLLTSLSGLLVMAAGVVLYQLRITDRYLASCIFGAGLFLPLMLLMWLARRACYVAGEPKLALAASLLYAILLIGGAVVVHSGFHAQNGIVWYLLLGLASVAGSLLIYLNPRVASFTRQDLEWRALLSEQWKFGKWIMLAAFLNFAGAQLQLFITAAVSGLDHAGILRALQNFMLPMTQVLAAISNLGLPYVAYEFGRGNYARMRSRSFKIAGVMTLIATLYAAALFAFAGPLEQIFYAGKFSNIAQLIPLIGLVPLITASELGFSLIVRALQRPIYYVVFTAAIALVGVTFGPILILRYGTAGALYTLIAIELISLAVNLVFYLRWFPKLVRESAA